MSITLAFGGSSGAWDDRELVKSYDAAMAEFHSHHPGPGSWLDKMTAQQALNQAASSSKAIDTAWYTASEPVAQMPEDEPVSTTSTQRPTKRPRTVGHLSRMPNQRLENPYRSVGSTSDRLTCPASPEYSPPSPRIPANVDLSSSPPTGERGSEAEETPPQKMSSSSRYPLPPQPISIHPTENVSAADAVSYAMTAQYWAGYWMGVSQALQSRQGETPATADRGDHPPRSPHPNVVMTKHRALKR